jgi:hypothetical protein
VLLTAGGQAALDFVLFSKSISRIALLTSAIPENSTLY